MWWTLTSVINIRFSCSLWYLWWYTVWVDFIGTLTFSIHLMQRMAASVHFDFICLFHLFFFCCIWLLYIRRTKSIDDVDFRQQLSHVYVCVYNCNNDHWYVANTYVLMNASCCGVQQGYKHGHRSRCISLTAFLLSVIFLLPSFSPTFHPLTIIPYRMRSPNLLWDSIVLKNWDLNFDSSP